MRSSAKPPRPPIVLPADARAALAKDAAARLEAQVVAFVLGHRAAALAAPTVAPAATIPAPAPAAAASCTGSSSSRAVAARWRADMSGSSGRGR